MISKYDAVREAHAAITSAHDEKSWEGLTEILDKLWDRSKDRAVFDHDMGVLSWDLVQGIERVGHKVVAERLGIPVEKLVERVLDPASLTMSELRMLALSAEVMISYTIHSKDAPTTEDASPEPAPKEPEIFHIHNGAATTLGLGGWQWWSGGAYDRWLCPVCKEIVLMPRSSPGAEKNRVGLTR